MKTRFLGMAVSILLSGMLTTGEAQAWLDDDEYGHAINGCGTSVRISQTDATCLTASSDGAKFNIKNECKDYGEIAVYVDRGEEAALLYIVGDTDPREQQGVHDVQSFSCCADRSDLCYKSQVEADSQDRILRVTTSASGISRTYQSVATHQDRYDFCQENPDDVYCEADPSGDATISPDERCEGAPCAVFHCRSNFRRSPAAAGSNSCTTLGLELPPVPEGFTATDPPHEYSWYLEDDICTVSYVSCTTDTSDGAGTGPRTEVNAWNDPTNGTETSLNYDIDVDVLDMDNLRYCDWNYCADSGAFGRRWGIVEGECPESATMAYRNALDSLSRTLGTTLDRWGIDIEQVGR